MSAVRLPDRVQTAVNDAQAQFAEVNKANADLQKARIRKKVNDALGRSYRELPRLRGDRRAEVDPRQRHRDLARRRRVDRAELLQEVTTGRAGGAPRRADPVRDRLDRAQRGVADPAAAPARRDGALGGAHPRARRRRPRGRARLRRVSRPRRSSGSPATSTGTRSGPSSRRGCPRPRRGPRRSTGRGRPPFLRRHLAAVRAERLRRPRPEPVVAGAVERHDRARERAPERRRRERDEPGVLLLAPEPLQRDGPRRRLPDRLGVLAQRLRVEVARRRPRARRCRRRATRARARA